MLDSADEFATLMSRVRSGEEDALAELVRRYEPELRVAARVRLGPALRPHLDSMDLVQSVHGSLIRGLRENQFDISSPQKLIALAVTLVRYKIAHHWRHLQRQQRLSGGSDEGNMEGLLVSLSDPGNDPASTVQLRDQVRHLCQNLTPSDRLLVQLRLQGYQPAEIAERLGIDAVALRVRLTRLRQRLEACGVFAELF